ISLTSERKGFSVVTLITVLISPLCAEASLGRVIRAAAPAELVSHAGEPHRAKEDVCPKGHHQRMQEDRVEQRIAQRSEQDQARNADENHRGDRESIAGDRERVRKEMQD